MAEYKPYPEYKDSGVEWLGEVPGSWNQKRLKFSTQLINEKIEAQATDLEYMGLEHIESWSGCRIDDAHANSDGVAARFLPDDVLFGKLRPYLAKVHLAQHEGIVSTEALVIRPTEYIDPAFLRYFMVSKDFIQIVNSSTYGSKMPRASWDFIGNLQILLPSLPEQQTIARFLDHKTAQIDALIAKKQTLLEKLTEKRTALISHAVTKGLNPNAKMKDSGVEWLGDVPEHWDIKCFRFACEFLNRKRIPLSSEERGSMTDRVYPYYGASGIIDYIEDYIFDQKTILIAEDGANLLSRSTPLAFIADGKYWVNNHAHILNPIKGPFEYWSNLLCTIQYEPWITGAAQPKLTKENLGGIQLPLPPEDEQHDIAKYIADHASNIDPMMKKVTIAIEKLKEYRAALIPQAVTGKIDVRNIKVPKTTVKGQAA